MNNLIKTLLIAQIILFGIYCAINNQDKIYAYKANKCFKKNDLVCTQKNFEKAFEHGYDDPKGLELYTNSIINSPLNIESQEKLLKIYKETKNSDIQAKINFFFENLRDEIHKTYPNNFISQTVHNQKVVRWNSNLISFGFVNSENIPKYFVEEISSAFDRWEKISNHLLMFFREDENPNIKIVFKPHNPADNDDKKYVVAYVVPEFSAGKLINMQMNFYTKDPSGEYFTKNQIYNTALHEIVHALGFMGHSNNKEDIMYLSKDSTAIIFDSKEEPSESDINTIKLLYKIKPHICNEDTCTGEYIPHLALGFKEDIVNAKIKEAKIYIKKAPNLPAGYIDLADGYVTSKEYLKAIKSLEKALELSNTDEIKSMVYYNLAVVHYLIGHYELAEDYIQNSISLGDSEDKHALLADIFTKQKLTAMAISEYEKLINSNPSNIEYIIPLVNIYITQSNYSKARKILKTFLNKNPQEKNNPRLAPYGSLKLFL